MTCARAGIEPIDIAKTEGERRGFSSKVEISDPRTVVRHSLDQTSRSTSGNLCIERPCSVVFFLDITDEDASVCVLEFESAHGRSLQERKHVLGFGSGPVCCVVKDLGEEDSCGHCLGWWVVSSAGDGAHDKLGDHVPSTIHPLTATFSRGRCSSADWPGD